MNRYRVDTNQNLQDRLRALAGNLRPRGRRALRLSGRTAAALAANLRRARRLNVEGDDALRLKQDAGLIEGCLHRAREQGPFLPAWQGAPRLLHLARCLVNGGAERPDKDALLRGAALFDSMQPLEMLEIQCLPAALNLALCEAMTDLSGEILAAARLRMRGEAWALKNGRGPVLGQDAFLEAALRTAAEQERAALHARLVRRAERKNSRIDAAVEAAQRMEADRCLRLENLMQLHFLLEGMNWRSCFEALSWTDKLLCQDPSRAYPDMDEPSRARVRASLADMALCLHVEEQVLAQAALNAALAAERSFGAEDHRACLCWYFAEDEGRARLCGELGLKKRPPRLLPDAGGRRSVALCAFLTALAAALGLWTVESALLMVFIPPLAWVCAQRLIARFYPRFVKPAPILRLRMDAVPDCARTLVTLPVLLSSTDRAREMVERIETLGCLERDANVDFLILADLRDADMPALPEDEEILRALRRGVEALNRRSEREKYFCLHRERKFRAVDGRWMGENRKRGALMALNALLEDERGAAEAFGSAEDAQRLRRGHRYVITLDADTRCLPGDLRRLIGAMEHPLNRRAAQGGRGYAVLQPCMVLSADAVENAYVQLAAGEGGMYAYPVSVSDFYQDMTGRGCFAGKGIYDVRAFRQATEGVLRDDAILSHDLIEGILSGAGSLADVQFYDSCPANLPAELQRLHRWTRGDWQLLPVLFSRIPMAAVDRMKLLGNLLRSLYAPALLGLLIHAIWLDAPLGFTLGLAIAFQDALLRPLKAGRQGWKRALLRLAVLPAEAACMLDAILRTLWRLAVSRRGLMDWVPAADAADGARRLHIPGRVAALLVLPGLLRLFWAPAALAMAALFAFGTAWADDLARTPVDRRGSIGGSDRAFLMELARRTWRFFAEAVPADGCGLPPDNIQLDPPAGIAWRTSPTNIGLYMMSCLAACELELIPAEEARMRILRTARTLEQLEKWQGQLYNWYDIRSLAPLRPRYVSAVDSGNLAGALLLCAGMLEKQDAALAARLNALAEEMDLSALYDADRNLFCIGMDVDAGRRSDAHYDLYASEARILSFTAMMLGRVPLEHWQRLSRAPSGRGRALLSWSGTMFEYLMPELILPGLPDTLAGASCRAAIACQMQQGRAKKRPWGVSESGYCAFDLHFNYQYRAFGLSELALSGGVSENVCAPYASALALPVAPAAAIANLRRMCALGWWDEAGLFEAADYLNADAAGAPRLVRSHMAHHQGMILCALCNALRQDVFSRSFMALPRARSLALLLQERQGPRPRRARRKLTRGQDAPARPRTDTTRRGRQDCAVDAQLLHGGETMALATARGAVFAWSRGLQLNRFTGDLQGDDAGLYVHLYDHDSGTDAVLGSGARVEFRAGSAAWRQDFGGVQTEMNVFVSPETGALYQQLALENTAETPRSFTVTGCMAAALATDDEMRSHPVFHGLFVEGRRAGENALTLRRRHREADRQDVQLVYILSGAGSVRTECSLEKLTGRTGALGRPGGIEARLEGGFGHVLNPCAALQADVRIAPGETVRLHFALALAENDEAEACVAAHAPAAAAERARQLAEMQTRAVLSHAGVDAKRFRLFQRASVFLFDARLRRDLMESAEPCPHASKRALWGAGISGDLPILLAEFSGEGELDCVREVMRMHAFWHMMGARADLVLLNCRGCDYLQGARTAVGDMIASGRLSGSAGMPGGVYALEIQNIGRDALNALRRSAALCFNGKEDFFRQLRRALDGLLLHETPEAVPMAARPAPQDGQLAFFNGFGGFDADAYVIRLENGALPPAPWSNIICSEHCGALVTERGGGFAWRENSRSGRLTAFANDALREGWGWMFYLADERSGRWLRLLPGDEPMTGFRVRHAPGVSSWSGWAEDVRFDLRMQADVDGLRFDITLRNDGRALRQLRLAGFVDWLMGEDSRDAARLRTWARGGACFASGSMAGIGCFLADDPRARGGCDRQTLFSGGDIHRPRGLNRIDAAGGGWTLHMPMVLPAGETRRCRFLLGWAESVDAAEALAREFRGGAALRRSSESWPDRLDRLRIETPDPAVNALAGGFLQAQVLNARVRGRAGLYQPGGAYGFRDQLQDMLPLIHYEPERVRAHLLKCAARQFEAGDVMHWWHEPYTGVRTRISDDLLFLPWVTAAYVRVTGDHSLLSEPVPFLRDVSIPDGREDVYGEMRPSESSASLHEHCMRAFRRAADRGVHGLCRMGGGDWNDGMNRIGAGGRGESIWLSEFLAVCARDYSAIAPDAQDKEWLEQLEREMKQAVEAHGWDGAWYLRAYGDDGRRIGGSESACCRIDAISQAWAVFADLNPRRARAAMDAAWEQLVDAEHGLIRLLTPPFDGRDFDPGYIAAYPPGVRENGGQYTHAACWLLLALIEMGDEARAHRALEMLLPVNHARGQAEALRYRVEPYVMAADVYAGDAHAGRGGWSWYTGSAAWMLCALLRLLGYERRGERVRLHALLGKWPEISITLRRGMSSYRLVCRRDAAVAELDGEPLTDGWVRLMDDGRSHTAVFPARRAAK